MLSLNKLGRFNTQQYVVQDGFNQLQSDSTQVGSSALPLLNTSDDNRKSIFPGGDVRATNLVDTDLTNWSSVEIGSAVVVNTQDLVTFTHVVSGDRAYLQTTFAATSGQPFTVAFYADSNTLDKTSKVILTFGTVSGSVSIAAGDCCLVTLTLTPASTGTQTLRIGPGVDSGVTSVGSMTLSQVRATNTATPVSAFPAGSGAGFTKVDQVTAGGILVSSSLKGDENLLDTDLTNWNTTSSTPVTVDDFVYTATADVWTERLSEPFDVIAGEEYTFTFLAKKGTKTVYSTRIYDATNSSNVAISVNGGTPTANTIPYTSYINSNTFSLITVKFTAPAGSTSCTAYLTVLDSVGTVLLKNARTVKSSAPAAGFPDGSPANTDYAKDILTFLRTFTATATMQFTVTPYGWSNADNPAAAECVLFESGAFRLKVSAAGFVEIDGTAVSTKKLTANTLSVITVKYDGVNHTLQVDGEAPVVVASAIIPSGTSYVGNNAAGTNPSHAVEHIDIYDNKLLTAAEITTGEEGLQARLGSMTLY